MQPYILGIDIGTGSTKAIAVSYTGDALGQSQHYYPTKSLQPGYSEQDPALILDAFVLCVTDVTKKIGYAPKAISFSSAMHSLMPVDASGKALIDMMTWADSRSTHIAQNLMDSGKGPALYKISGTPIHAMTPLCKIIWISENKEDIFKATHKFISIKEYIWYHLFNNFQIDYALASATGLFDIIKLDWNKEAFAVAGITTESVSAPVNTTYQRAASGTALLDSLGLSVETIFVIGASDGCCANLGSHITTPDKASLTIGTSGAVRITSLKPVYDTEAMIFNYLLDEKTFVCGGAVNNGGIALDWLIKSFLDKKLPGHNDYDAVFKQIATVPAGSEGLIFLPYLYGERAPIWDTKSCGVFFNIKPIHTKEHFLRAGLEGICFALNDVLQTIEQSSGPVKNINISGGFITSPVWTRILADITGKRLSILQQEDASALGAIFLGMRALNLSIPEAPKSEEGADIIPDKYNHFVYTKSFGVYKRLYKHLKATMHWVKDLE